MQDKHVVNATLLYSIVFLIQKNYASHTILSQRKNKKQKKIGKFLGQVPIRMLIFSLLFNKEKQHVIRCFYQ